MQSAMDVRRKTMEAKLRAAAARDDHNVFMFSSFSSNRRLQNLEENGQILAALHRPNYNVRFLCNKSHTGF